MQPQVEIQGASRWRTCASTSSTTLTADVPMSLMPSTPLGTADDVTVTVPEGCGATLPGGFTLFPPPTLTGVRPGSVCVDRPSNTLTLTGTNFHAFEGRVPTVRIEATPPVELTGVQVVSPTTLTGTLPGNVPGGGPYDVTVTTPVGCPAVLARAFTYHPAPTITAASAQASCTGGNPVVLITGTNLHATDGTLPTVRLLTTPPITLGMVRVTAPSTIIAELPTSLPMGNYAVEVTMPEGCAATSAPFAYNPAALIPPSLAGMIPSRGWNGIDMPVIIQGTGLATLTGLALRGAAAGGGDLALTDIAVVGNDLINATIPAGGRAGGPYDLISTVSGCAISLPRAYTLTDTPAITMSAVTPPFGWTGASTPIVVQGAGFVSTPRMFLVVPGLTPRMRALSRPVFLSGTSVSALVPQGLPPGTYDLAAINPDGGGGLLRGAFRVTMLPPPTIESVTPGAGTTQSPTAVSIQGENFRAPVVTLRSSTGATFNASVSGSTARTLAASLPTNTLTPGAYLVRVTNPDEGTYADFGSFVVTNPAQKLGAFEAASALVTPRRGAAALASQVTPVTRFLYAIGGDGGMGGATHDSVEFAPVDLFGRLGAWRVQRYALPAAVSAIATSAVEHRGFLYVLGGASAAGSPVSTVLRARVLDFRTAPVIADPELTRVSTGGLAPGAWLYRVAAVMAPTDRDNPGGEGLPSDEVTAFFVFRSTVSLRWSAVSGATSYRVYRSPMANGSSGGETLLATVAGSATTFTDDGTGTTMAASIQTQPLAVGSTGVWRALGTGLGTARAGAAAALAPDPNGNLFVYAITGRGTGGPVATYEYASLSDDGATLGSFTAGAQPFVDARELAAAVVASPRSAPAVNAGTFVYVTGGFSARDSLRSTEIARVGVGGALASMSATTSYSQGRGGLGAIVVNNEFYAVGGTAGTSTAAAARDTADSSTLAASGTPGNFSNATADARLLAPRARFGFALSGAHLFLVGGTTSGSEALSTVERTLY
ncbi:MAG: IPT/TIG domain-containing protein [Polyangiales bacterium]